jgi:flagellar biogenesis protein FliO
MPSTARIAMVILLSALSGDIFAQAINNVPMDRLPAVESERPAWASEIAPGPVKIAPPISAANRGIEQTSYAEPRPGGGNENNLRLSPPNREPHKPMLLPGKANSQDAAKISNGLPPIATMAGSLGVVVGIFLLIAWLMRRAAPQGLARLPNEAFEVLGRAPLAGRQNVHLLRCGNKLLLVSITPAGTETLTEITEPPEVDRLAGLCRQAGPHSTTAAFRQIFEKLAPKNSSKGGFSQDEFAGYYPSEMETTNAMGWEHRDD